MTVYLDLLPSNGYDTQVEDKNTAVFLARYLNGPESSTPTRNALRSAIERYLYATLAVRIAAWSARDRVVASEHGRLRSRLRMAKEMGNVVLAEYLNDMLDDNHLMSIRVGIMLRGIEQSAPGMYMTTYVLLHSG